ncbi:MAG: hypothetical protein RIS92_1324, partial [Verrucomicrobiota bacterium]
GAEDMREVWVGGTQREGGIQWAVAEADFFAR